MTLVFSTGKSCPDFVRVHIRPHNPSRQQHCTPGISAVTQYMQLTSQLIHALASCPVPRGVCAASSCRLITHGPACLLTVQMIDLIASRTKPMVHLSYRGSGTAAAQTEFMGPAGKWFVSKAIHMKCRSLRLYWGVVRQQAAWALQPLSSAGRLFRAQILYFTPPLPSFFPSHRRLAFNTSLQRFCHRRHTAVV